jgi:hypothetical protein
MNHPMLTRVSSSSLVVMIRSTTGFSDEGQFAISMLMRRLLMKRVDSVGLAADILYSIA